MITWRYMKNLWAVMGELKVEDLLWYLRPYVIAGTGHIKDLHSLKGFVCWKFALFCSILFMTCSHFHSCKGRVKGYKNIGKFSLIMSWLLTGSTEMKPVAFSFFDITSFCVVSWFIFHISFIKPGLLYIRILKADYFDYDFENNHISP